MNLLNPLALFGLLAAGIPLLLHLLNLRKLRVVEFSSLRFLHELQQTRVRRLRLQQILLLILRTLIIVFAVLAFARPTVPGKLPLLASAQRSSVVILVDNSASMEASDGRGQRFTQAQQAVRSIIDGLKDGDEVVVVPMAGLDRRQDAAFTRTFAVAKETLDKIRPTDDRADVVRALHVTDGLLREAVHAHREVFIVSDLQSSSFTRIDGDSTTPLREKASVYLVRIGEGVAGLERNLSIDSVAVLTSLVRSDRPVEIEAFVRNGSTEDAVGSLVTLSYDGVRVAQRAIDIPAGSTRSIVVSAPPQRRGIISAAVELERDAIVRDNVRWTAVIVPPRPRTILIGSTADIVYVRTVLTLPGLEDVAPELTYYPTVSAAASRLSAADAIILCGGPVTTSDVALLSSVIERGAGLYINAYDGQDIKALGLAFGLGIQDVTEAPSSAPWRVKNLDRQHPLFQGVFKSTGDDRSVETPSILRQRSVTGGTTLASSDGGAILAEASLGAGRVIYCGLAPTTSWSTWPMTGLFAATTVRSVLYLTMPRDAAVQALRGESVSLPVPPRLASRDQFALTDVTTTTRMVAPVRLPSSVTIPIPSQNASGVVKVTSDNMSPVGAVAFNAPVEESQLQYDDVDKAVSRVATLVVDGDRVVGINDSADIRQSIAEARTGSELWPLFLVLALLSAFGEMFVARYAARDGGVTP
ncbi:MAG TPA: BatA and WFA domain-containing protein [Chlorobiota bacterium]|nr:BatA and WFA domain-containing protein [Chlorobiota bacterium]